MYYMCNKAAKMRHCLELMLNSLLELSLWTSVLARKLLNTEIIETLIKMWERMEIL